MRTQLQMVFFNSRWLSSTERERGVERGGVEGSLGQLAGGIASIAQLQNKQSNEAQRIIAI